MNSLGRATISLQDLPHLFLKYRKLLFSGAVVGLLLFMGLSFVVPPKYKVSFLLTIDPRFFQSPLVGEFIPGAGSPGEMKTQGESLLRQSFTPEFLDSLDQKFQLYYLSKSSTEPTTLIRKIRRSVNQTLLDLGVMREPVGVEYQRVAERQDVIRHIELFSAYGTTYRIGFMHGNPDTAYRVAQELYKNSTEFLIAFRTRNMSNIQDAITHRLASLNSGGEPVAPPTSAPVAIDTLREQLQRVRQEIQTASHQFTEAHPYIQELKKQESALENQLESGVRINAPAPSNAASDGEANRSVYGDLTRKINYLRIAMDSDRARQSEYFTLLEAPIYPSAPLFPKKPLFAVWGLSFGLAVAFFCAILLEYFDRSALRAEVVAKHLGLPLIGRVPALSHKGTLPVALLEAPLQKGPDTPSAPRR